MILSRLLSHARMKSVAATLLRLFQAVAAKTAAGPGSTYLPLAAIFLALAAELGAFLAMKPLCVGLC
ncbi:uncharacterized protein (DUF2062 family) [Rhizobium paranaense]|uniref:Uncharacterized protein (DUF2062 family) n=1 Tax=Rhizobium paranaense TaxID=1650438 RepID=A0A7W8XTJ1_9HYPH|nr:uncharacterized protein (DUF2062 family) [Rhizobium paranaense]